MGALSNKFLETVRKHLELGTSLQYMNMSDDQKTRVRYCMEVYNLLKQNPYLEWETYLKNKYNRTYWEIRADKECLNFITSILDAGGKDISRLKVKRTYELAAKMAHDQGNTKDMISAAKHISDLEGLTEPEQGEDLENSITKLPIVLTQDVRNILPGKQHTSDIQKDKLRKKWGVKKDAYQEMVDTKAEELRSSSSSGDGSGFDLSLLSEGQLLELSKAIESRMKISVEDDSDISDEEEWGED